MEPIFYLLIVCAAMSLFAFAFYGADKLKAKQGAWRVPEKVLLSLSFFGGNADKPVVSGMIRECGVDANILSGNLDQLKDRIYGNLLIVIEGGQDALENAEAYLRAQNLQVEVLGYVK